MGTCRTFSLFEGLSSQAGDHVDQYVQVRRVDPKWKAGDLAIGRPLCLLLDLGPKGLPHEVIAFSKGHPDVTCRGVALEVMLGVRCCPRSNNVCPQEPRWIGVTPYLPWTR